MLKRYKWFLIMTVLSFFFVLLGLMFEKAGETKILYGFMQDGNDSPGFVFYQADLENPLELHQVRDASAGEMPGRDISLYQDKNGKLYGATTGYDLTRGVEIFLYEGDNVQNLSKNSLDLGIAEFSKKKGRQVEKIWAPDFFEDRQGRVYLFTAANDRGTRKDKSGAGVPSHSLYRTAINLETKTASETREVNLPLKKNYIDAHVFQMGSAYYMLVKDETEKVFDLYRSTDLDHWELVREDLLSDVSQGQLDYIEGEFTLKIDDTYYLFFDKYVESEAYTHNQYVTTTKDFQTFTPFRVVTDDEHRVLRHGSAILYRMQPYRQELNVLKLLTFLAVLLLGGLTLSGRMRRIQIGWFE